jgi:mevalonate kinase
MLLGEHAVLDGSLSLVCAVNRRIRMTLTPEKHDQIAIQSAKERYYVSALDQLLPDENFKFVIAAARRFQHRFPGGFSLTIDAEFSDQLGMGSSAAVTVATVAVLQLWLGDTMTPDRLHAECLAVVQEVQGSASGADLAASIHGGIIAYRMTPKFIERMPGCYPISVVNSNQKIPTVEVINKVRKTKKEFPTLYRQLYGLIDNSCEMAAAAIKKSDWPTVGRLLSFNHGLMMAMGLSNATLNGIVHTLEDEPDVLGAKISGSGLGDCVVALGKIDNPNFPYPLLPLMIDKEGLKIE